MDYMSRLIAVASLCVLAACSSGSDPVTETGTLSLSVTDAPVDDAAAVWLAFIGVELKPSGGQSVTIDFDEVKNIDLLAQQGGLSEPLISDRSVTAGEYEWVRLKVNAQSNVDDDSYIVLKDGGQFSLVVPSGDQTGLKLNNSFTVTAGGQVHFTIDFDLRKSITAPPGLSPDYVLRPTLRIIDNARVGTIQGTVDPALFAQVYCASNADGATGEGGAVYLYSDTITAENDCGSDDEPLTSALIGLNTGTGIL